MSQLFSTDLLPPADRIDAWQWNAQQICGDCRFELPRSSFHGSIEIRNVGGLRLTRFSSSPLFFWKWPCDSVTLENRSCIVITQLAGARRYLQGGSSVLLKPGDSTVIDSGRPWSSTCSTDCTRLYLRVPRWMVENRLQRRDVPIATRICGRAGLGAVLQRLSLALYEDAERMDVQEGASALNAYFEVLAACMGGGEAIRQGSAELRARIYRFIETHMCEPALGPAEVAAALGISVRHLHRIFSVSGQTLADFIRGRRLEQCRRDLANPRLQRKTITDIAFFWGFSDSAHFSHSFAKHFGMSPRAFRAQAVTRDHHPPLRHGPSDFLAAAIAEFRCPKPN